MNSHSLYDIAFSLEENIHTTDRVAMISQFGNAENLYANSNFLYSVVSGRKINVKPKTIEKAKQLHEFIVKSNINTVLYSEPEYPALLHDIPDPPFLLYLRGNVSLFQTKKISVVGTRNADSRAMSLTKSLTVELVKSNYTITSGLAKGIDIMAHTTTMSCKGNTIGVLGSGIDITYPAAAKTVVRKMLDSDNLIISEYPPSVLPYKHHFPIRNRIIAGLSDITIVIQCPERSGSSITASLAGDYGRELFVYNPGENYTTNYEGNVRILNTIPVENGFSSLEYLIETINARATSDAEVAR
ncbi:MAG: DNA protecting protein DprA [Spirochaetes bacterium GWF1_31_7]|nr:MAG: DNA protecting protein DprA [Spirochaetes bacterium GWE1_32_154]OHD49104.1 MAG: DNA protecting protein DprA [Spirochaetes bacterium GWF1_31_7]OHD50310.1 MAG: DNA protecting protein DprA [Spirochaetes bacterium GWE2_31_10]OHD81356.1 MAG: DNA protecting protein DprA [Spirochaetes bacterium RIFOXYB1_FULL_32_8]HBD93902.1 DNA-protecting protein DprA [Spirochaetia bacterium]